MKHGHEIPNGPRAPGASGRRGNDRQCSRSESLIQDCEKPDGLDLKLFGAELSGNSLTRTRGAVVSTTAWVEVVGDCGVLTLIRIQQPSIMLLTGSV